MHDTNRVAWSFSLAVIEKCHICDGQTDTQTDRQTDGKQTQAFLVLNLQRYDPYQHFDPEKLS